MRCNDLLRKLAEYEDGLLPADLCATLESHLADCIPCAELRRDLRLLSGLCRQASRPPMPEGLRLRLLALLRRDDTPS
jgi:anti-sigma factor RsiW